MTPEQKEAKKARASEYYAEHREEYKAYRRNNRDKNREYHRKYIAEHREEWNASMSKQRRDDINKNGVTKNYIRTQSNRLLFKIHSKIQGYEIHHCFGYEDPNKFIYIPKNLHNQIHRLLRDNNILADSNHWNVIRDLVNSYEGYTYIRT